MSALLAFLVWLYARSRDQDTLDNVPIFVDIAVAPGQAEQYELEVRGPAQIPVSFTGPPSRIREVRARLQNGEVRASLTVPVPDAHANESRYSETVRVLSRHIHAPPGTKPTVVEGQNRIPITLHRLVERRLPVRLEHTGEGRITQVAVDPPHVLVRGPQELLDRMRSAPTQSYTVADANEMATGPQTIITRPIPLMDRVDGRRITVNPKTVVARLTLQPAQKLYVLDDVPVQFLCPPGFALRPQFGDERGGKITLRLRGPSAEDAPAVIAYVDLSSRKWAPGLYEERVRLHLPRDYHLVGDPPGPVSFQLSTGNSAGP